MQRICSSVGPCRPICNHSVPACFTASHCIRIYGYIRPSLAHRICCYRRSMPPHYAMIYRHAWQIAALSSLRPVPTLLMAFTRPTGLWLSPLGCRLCSSPFPMASLLYFHSFTHRLYGLYGIHTYPSKIPGMARAILFIYNFFQIASCRRLQSPGCRANVTTGSARAL